MCLLEKTAAFVARRFIQRPIIVVGGSRSGTSVLTHALGKHPEIYSYNGEAPFITDIGGMVHGLEYADATELEYYHNALRISHAYIYAELRQLAFESAFGPAYGFRGMARDFFKGDFRPSATRWCAKSFPSRVVADGLQRLFPDVRFVMIHRSGIDVVHSRTKFHGFKDMDFRAQCEDWARSIRDFGYLTDYPSAMAMRHQDILDRPQAVFREVFSFLELPDHPGAADYCQNNQVHPLEARQTESHVDVKTRMASRPPAYEAWTEQQKDIFRESCGEAMENMGYSMPF